MTLKTSLIITGDSKAAVGAVEALAASVEKAGAASGKASPQTRKLGSDLDAVAQAAKGAIAAVAGVDALMPAVAGGAGRASAAIEQLNRNVGLQRAGYQQLGFQLQDVAASYASGTHLTTIFAQQAGQAASAIALIAQGADNSGSKIGKLAGILGGPWGIAATVAISLGAALWNEFAKDGDEAATAAGQVDRLTQSLNRLAGAQGKVTAADLGNAKVKLAQLEGQLSTLNQRIAGADGNRAMRQERLQLRAQQIELERDISNTRATVAASEMRWNLQTKASEAASQAAEKAASASSRSVAARNATSAADRDAAEAARKLQADLYGVIGRYDATAKAAADYADELARIDRLSRAGKIDTGAAENYKAQASAAYLGGAIDLDGIRKAAGFEQDDIDKLASARGAIDDIVRSVNDEIGALAALDPVQRASIKHRKELAALPEAERAAATQRIATAEAEVAASQDVARATEEARRAQQQLGDMAVDAFTAIAIGGQKASDVVGHLAQTIAAAAVQATLFGTGPLAAMLNGSVAPAVGSSAQSAAADMAGKSLSKSLSGAIDTSMDKVFGAKGSFATTLKNTGLGYAAGGMTGSRTGGAIGGAIGGAVGKELLGSALGSLGQFAGPIGAIAGGLLGGAIGGLLKKTKTGAANITSVDGAATISGNSSQFKAAASGAAGNVQDGLASIAQQLGGSVGGFNVTIGQRHGDWRVRTGEGSLKVAKGAKEFDDDQAGAIAYAIQLAVSQGAVTGLSGAVQKALSGSADIDKALTEALKVQDVESLLGGIGGEMAKAFKSLETQAKERVRIANQYGFDVVAIEKKNAEDRVKLVDQILADRVGSLQSLLDDMNFGSLAEGSAADQRIKLLAEIGKARSDAEAGVDGAADKLANLSRSLIDLTEDKFGTAGTEYTSDRNTVTSAVQAVIAAEKSRVSAA